MRRRTRRRSPVNTDLDITAFLNLMVILIPFLLITAVFSRVTVLDLYLPPNSDISASSKNQFNLEIIIRDKSVLVQESSSRLKKIIKKKDGAYDLNQFSSVLKEIKQKFPDKRDASILPEPNISYDTLVQVMDYVRMYEMKNDDQTTLVELFPGISIGDAPTRKSK